MQGYRVVFFLCGLLAVVVGSGLWFGLPGLTRQSDDGESTITVVAPPPEEPEPAVVRPPVRAEPSIGRGRLTGRILLFKTKEPVQDVIVKLTAGPEGAELTEETTDEEGWFNFTGLPAGQGYELVVEHGEFAPVRRLDLTVVNGEVSDVGIIFLEKAVSFVVRVVDGKNAPIAEAEVSVYSATGPTSWTPSQWMERVLRATEIPTPLHTATTEESGEVRVDNFPAGYYSMAAEAKGYARSGVEKLISPETAEEPVVIRLGTGYELSGLVLGENDEFVKGRVLVTPGSRQFAWGHSFLRKAVEISEAGEYKLTGLAPGPASLMVEPEGQGALPAGTVSIPDIKEFDIRLGEGAVLVGTITDEEEKPIAGAEVRVIIWSPRGGQSFGASALSDEKGEYRIEGLPEGNVSSPSVIAEGFAKYPPPGDWGEDLFLSRGTTLRIDVTMLKGLELDGKVTTETDGKPVTKARVVAIPRGSWGGNWEHAETGEDGAFLFTSLNPGEYALQVIAEGAYQPDFPGPWQAQQAGTELDDRWKVRIEQGVQRTTKDLVLTVGGEVSGRVEDTQGQPVAGARVRLSNMPYNALPVFSSQDGTFKFTGVKAADRATVSAYLPGRYARSDPFSIVPAGNVENIILRLKASCRITGTVELSDGRVPSGGTVKWVRGDPRRNRWLMRRGTGGVPVGDDGSFEIENVSPGTVTVIANVPGYQPGMSDTLNISEGLDMEGIAIRVEPGHKVKGTVNLKTGEPVESADISVVSQGRGSWGWSPWGGSQVIVAQSDAEGQFTIEGLGEGKHRIDARKEGLTPATANGVNAAAGDEVRLEMEAGGEIKGVVLDDKDAPVGGLRIYLRPMSGNRNRALPQSSTSTDGTFKLQGVPEGTYKLFAAPGWGSKLNFTSAEKEGVRPGDPDIEIRVEPGFKISGYVMAPDGNPAAGYEVSAAGQNAQGKNVWKYQETKFDGTFEFPGLPAGNYRITVESNGGGIADAVENGVAAGTTDLTIVLKKAMDIEGVVSGPDGFVASRVRVRANPMPGVGGSGGSARTGNDGRFKISGLSPGEYRLTFSAPGRFVTFVLDNVPAGTGGLNVQLEEGKKISGVVTDYEGFPVKGVPVMAMPVKGGTMVSAASNAEGKFEIKGLGDGKHRLTTGHNKEGWVLDKPVEAEAGAKDVKIVVDTGLSLSGVVVDGTGKGIQNAYIYISRGGSGWSRSKSDGSFTIVGLRPGAVQLRVWWQGNNAVVDATAGEQGVQIRFD
ncbi:MAG: carboxypeptidase regulatory-like domain-containing protein [Planctomycetota bacterium]|jgi:protocatechuate 3,4-dioxygenase beta subunit